MNHRQDPAPAPTAETMVDAKDAAGAMRLPYYWFSDQAMRNRQRIPHYVLGGLVRYRLSELAIWAARGGAQHVDAANDADAGADSESMNEGTE